MSDPIIALIVFLVAVIVFAMWDLIYQVTYRFLHSRVVWFTFLLIGIGFSAYYIRADLLRFPFGGDGFFLYNKLLLVGVGLGVLTLPCWYLANKLPLWKKVGFGGLGFLYCTFIAGPMLPYVLLAMVSD